MLDGADLGLTYPDGGSAGGVYHMLCECGNLGCVCKVFPAKYDAGANLCRANPHSNFRPGVQPLPIELERGL